MTGPSHWPDDSGMSDSLNAVVFQWLRRRSQCATPRQFTMAPERDRPFPSTGKGQSCRPLRKGGLLRMPGRLHRCLLAMASLGRH